MSQGLPKAPLSALGSRSARMLPRLDDALHAGSAPPAQGMTVKVRAGLGSIAEEVLGEEAVVVVTVVACFMGSLTRTYGYLQSRTHCR